LRTRCGLRAERLLVAKRCEQFYGLGLALQRDRPARGDERGAQQGVACGAREQERIAAAAGRLLDTRGDEGLSLEQAEAIAEAAVEECERFYPVFQFVLWGGKSPGEAIAAALIDTHGEA